MSCGIPHHPVYNAWIITWTNQAQSSSRTKRRGRHPHHALAPAFVRTAPSGHHIDGNGLYLYVQPTGARSWIQRLVIRGRRCELGLGAVALVSLAEAREQAVANRKLARAGGDPLADRRRVQGMPTFAEAAITVIDQKRAGWKTRAQVQAWRGSLERYAFPRIGRRPISEVASADVLAILTPIWHTKPVIAKTVKQRIHTVLEWAIAMNLRTDNPSDRVGPVLGPSATSCSTCGRCRTGRLPRRSRRCRRQARRRPSRWRSSFWC